MSDLISRAEASELYFNLLRWYESIALSLAIQCHDVSKAEKNIKEEVERRTQAFNNLPSVEPSRQEGEWVNNVGLTHYPVNEIECSACHSISLNHYTDPLPVFCQWCGSRMTNAERGGV